MSGSVGRAVGDIDGSRQLVQGLLGGALMKHVQAVAAGRNIGDGESRRLAEAAKYGDLSTTMTALMVG